MSLLGRIFNIRRLKEPRYPNEHVAPLVQRSLAGVVVTPDTAPQNPAVMAAAWWIQQQVGMLPWRVKETIDEGDRLVPGPIDWMLWKRPSPEFSSFQFRETLLHWALFWGNGIAEIERDGAGRPFALHPIPPWRVEIVRDPETRQLVYEVNNGDGQVDLSPNEVFHIRGFGHGPVGIGVVAWAAQTLGHARAVQLFAGTFFGNGMNVSGVIKNKRALTPEGLKRQRAEFESLYKGPMRSNKTAILDNDAEWQAVGIDPAKSQLVDVSRFMVEDVARLFGVAPHIIGDLMRSTNNNIEHQGRESVQKSLMPWIVRFEDEADYKLFGQNRRGLFTEMDVKELMRGDAQARSVYMKSMFDTGAMSSNDIRRSEGMNTIGPAGDKYLVQLNLTTLDRAGEAEAVAPTAEPVAAPAEDIEDDAVISARLEFERKVAAHV